MATTLGMLGLMNESNKNIIRGMKPSTLERCFGNIHCMLLMFPNKEV
jgi:hypothetical protein